MKNAFVCPHVRIHPKFTWVLLTVFLAGVLCVGSVASAAKKMKPEELVAKHLESIGSAEALSAITSRDIKGECVLSMRVGGSGKLAGTVRMASTGKKNLLDMNFSMPDYPHERAAFDGKKVTVGQLKPGIRSYLANFLRTQDVILKEGLLCGTISTAWPLLDVKERKAKLKYQGLKKIDGRELHELRYRPRRGGGDVRVLLYFDQETFQHVRTQYRMTISAGMGTTPEESARQSVTRVQIVEDFSNFAQEGELTLPHSYRMQFTRSGERSVIMDWASNLLGFTYNTPIDSGDFKVDKTK